MPWNKEIKPIYSYYIITNKNLDFEFISKSQLKLDVFEAIFL